MNQEETYNFFCRELAKLNDSAKLFSRLGEATSNGEIDIKYKPVVDLFFHVLTRAIVTNLYCFVDKSHLSLNKLDGMDLGKIENLRKKYDDWFKFRHERISHLSKDKIHDDNFQTLTRRGLKELQEFIIEIHELLNNVANKNKYDGYFLGWVGLDISIEDFVDGLKKKF